MSQENKMLNVDEEMRENRNDERNLILQAADMDYDFNVSVDYRE